MSLTTEIRVNGELIASIEITREAGSYSTNPVDVNDYRWSYSRDGHEWTLPASIQHRYGDGAHELVDKVLAQINLRQRIANEMSAP